MKLVALLVITAAIGWATQCGHKITVYLRGRSVVRNPVWSQARNTVAKIFFAANVQIGWRTGDQLPVERAIVVSIVAHAPVDSLRGALAFTRPYEGVHITVFWDRVEHPVRPASKGVILAHVLGPRDNAHLARNRPALRDWDHEGEVGEPGFSGYSVETAASYTS